MNKDYVTLKYRDKIQMNCLDNISGPIYLYKYISMNCYDHGYNNKAMESNSLIYLGDLKVH